MKNQNHLANTRPEEMTGYMAPMVLAGEWAEQDGIKLRQIAAALIRRRKIMLAAFLGMVILAAGYTWGAKPTYKASARILVDSSERPSTGSGELPLLSDLAGMTQARSVETQAEIIKSPPILHGALKRLNYEDRRALGKIPSMDVRSIKGTDVIVVSSYSHSPKAAAALSNAICDEYLQTNRLRNREQTHAAAEYVRQQMSSIRAKLNDAQTALKSYKEQNLTVDLPTESQQRIAQMTQIQTDLRQAEAERAANIAQLGALRGIASGMKPTQVASTMIAPSPVADAIRQDLTKLESERTAALQEYTADSPEVERIDRQIADARKRLEREAQTEVRGMQTAVNPVRQSVSQEIAATQAAIWAQEARRKALKTACAGVKADLSRLPEREYRLAELTTEVGVLSRTYQMLNEEYQRLRISEEARLANARVIAPADLPDHPFRPRKALNMVLAIVFGLMLSVGLAALLDRMDDRVHSEEDVESWTGCPVLAHVPFIKSEAERCLTGAEKRNMPLLESFRMLRNNIIMSMVDETIRSVVITSGEPNEGKTHASANLAIAMALDGKRVVLVEGDLRKPKVHKLFELDNSVGITNVVSGKLTLDEALQETGVPGLKLLASGPLPPNPPEFLNSRACRACLQQVMDGADFVVVDSPPSLVMADAQVISTMTDGALLVVSAGQSRKHLVGRVSTMLTQTGTRLLGAIINKLQDEPGGYYGYYGYGYYSYHKYNAYYGAKELAEVGSKAVN